jgi:hypothetical protein
MRYDRRDRTKLIVLAVILAALWVFIGAMLRRHWQDKLAASEREHAATVAQEQAGMAAPGPGQERQVAAPTQQPIAPQAASRVAALVTPVPPPGRDPFQPKVPARTHGAATRPAAPPEPQPPVPLLPPPPQPAPSPAISRDILHVTGIIAGNPSAAVLRINESSVTLRDSQGTYVLRLGR